MPKHIIGIAGKKQSGKDTLGERLCRAFWWRNWTARKMYFGGAMKNFAHQYFGIPNGLLWGSDADKNTALSNITWEDFPVSEKVRRGRTGPMTVREVLQCIGEDMFLKFRPTLWIDIFEEEVSVCRDTAVIVCDIRKPLQVETVKKLGGVVIKLLRDPYPGLNQHVSETSLDLEVYDHSNFDAVIEDGVSIESTAELVSNYLKGWRILPS